MDMFRETLHPKVVGQDRDSVQGHGGDHSCQGTSLRPPLEPESVRLFPDQRRAPFHGRKGLRNQGNREIRQVRSKESLESGLQDLANRNTKCPVILEF